MPRYIRTQKSRRGYRFAGLSGMDADIKVLEKLRAGLKSSPANEDDEKWRMEWTARLDAEIEKKERGREQKELEAKRSRFVPRDNAFEL